MQKHRINTVVKVLVSLGCVAGISFFMKDKLKDAIIILRHGVDWKWFFAANLVYLLAQLLMTQRLRLLLKAQQIQLTFLIAFILNFIGLFFNLFLPSAVGGDIAKGFLIAKHSGQRMGATTAIIQDRLVGFVAMLALALAGLLRLPSLGVDPRVIKIIPFIVAGAAFLISFFFYKPLAEKFKWIWRLIPAHKTRLFFHELYHAIHEYRNHKIVLLKAVCLSWGGQLGLVVLYYLAAGSLGVWNNPEYYFVAVPVSCFICMLPSVGGMGVREAGILFFLNKIMPGEKALAISFLIGLIIYGFSLVGGVIYVFYANLTPKVCNPEEIGT